MAGTSTNPASLGKEGKSRMLRSVAEELTGCSVGRLRSTEDRSRDRGHGQPNMGDDGLANESVPFGTDAQNTLDDAAELAHGNHGLLAPSPPAGSGGQAASPLPSLVIHLERPAYLQYHTRAGPIARRPLCVGANEDHTHR